MKKKRLRLAFEYQTEILTRAMENHLDIVVQRLSGIRRFPGNSLTDTERSKFTSMAQGVLKNRPTVKALSWVVRVSDAERAEFEKTARRQIDPDFAIRELGEQGQLVPAEIRPEYFPLVCREPAPDKPQIFGFDVGSESDRHDAIKWAGIQAVPIASAPIPHMKDADRKSVFFFVPAYRNNVVPDDEADRPQAVIGYLIAVLQLDRLIDIAWHGLISNGIDLWLYDETVPADKRLALFRGGSRRGSPEETLEPRRTTIIDVPGRRWTLHFALTAEYVATHRSMQAWTVLASGMLFTGLLGGVLLVVTGRAAWIARLVEERTAELVQVNANLVHEIGERKRAEEALRAQEESLRQSEERFRLLVDGTTDYAIFMLDPQGRVVSWNVGATRINGYQAGEIVGQHFSRFHVPEAVRQGTPQNMIDKAASAGCCEQEGWRVRKDGSKFWASAVLTALRDANGQLKGFSKITRDLTERRRVELALEEKSRVIARIAETIPCILSVYDLQEQCNVFVNQGIESILGYAARDTQVPGNAIMQENIHPDDYLKVEWHKEQLQLAEDGAVIEMEFRMRHADGEWRWLHGRDTVFLRDDDGVPVQILGIAQDITQRKRLEQEVLEIAASEQRRIGQELHDGTGQELTGLCMLADNLAEGLRESAPQESPLAERIAKGLKQSLSQVRGLSRGLVPVEVDAEGLMAALTELTNRISELQGVRCVFECIETVPIEDNFTATQLYRIAQEAITNA